MGRGLQRANQSGSFITRYAFFRPATLAMLLLFTAILLPPIRMPEEIPDIRLEAILVLLTWLLVLLWHFATAAPVKLYKFNVNPGFLLLFLVILLSTTYAPFMLGHTVIGRDFFELVKLLLYIFSFTLVANMYLSEKETALLYNFALLVLLGSVCFGFAQYFNLGNINATVSPYYAPTQMRGLLELRRITGTTPNPNEFGALMVLASSLALSGALLFKCRRRRLLLWGCFTVFAAALLLTLSRTALLALVVAVLFILFIKYPSLRVVSQSFIKIAAVIVLLFLIALILLQFAPERFVPRIIELRDIASATSWQARLDMWAVHFELWKESPFLGWGPGKATMDTVVDNEWLLLLRRYGIFGLGAFLTLWLSFYRGLARVLKGARAEEMTALAVALQATLPAYAVYMIPAVVYHSLQLMPVLLLFLGLAYTQLKKQALIADEGEG